VTCFLLFFTYRAGCERRSLCFSVSLSPRLWEEEEVPLLALFFPSPAEVHTHACARAGGGGQCNPKHLKMRPTQIGAAPLRPRPPPHPSPRQASLAATAAAAAMTPPPPPPLLTWADVQADAAAAGLALTLSGLGPFFKLECALTKPAPAAARASPRPPLATLSGALAPPWLAPWAGGIAHIDTLEVRNRDLTKEEAAGVRSALGPAGVGGLLAKAAFAHAHEVGRCRTAEALAILDDEGTHARLVGAYKRVAGFREVRKTDEEREREREREREKKNGVGPFRSPHHFSLICLFLCLFPLLFRSPSSPALAWPTSRTCWCGAGRARAWTRTSRPRWGGGGRGGRGGRRGVVRPRTGMVEKKNAHGMALPCVCVCVWS